MTPLQEILSIVAAFLFPGWGQCWQGMFDAARLKRGVQILSIACISFYVCGLGLILLPLTCLASGCESVWWYINKPVSSITKACFAAITVLALCAPAMAVTQPHNPKCQCGELCHCVGECHCSVILKNKKANTTEQMWDQQEEMPAKRPVKQATKPQDCSNGQCRQRPVQTYQPGCPNGQCGQRSWGWGRWGRR